uniref:MAPK regulated corepressor interacting protein 2 n=1 Tax=Anser brachyrhynchus TaxID=132585 RepID=A0A8B9BCD7_9AVES
GLPSEVSWGSSGGAAGRTPVGRPGVVNGKRPQVLLSHAPGPEECYTAAHEENVRFVYEAWQEVEQQLDDSQRGESARGPVQYVEKTPNPSLKYFVPIDLEEWWAKQFLAKI